MKKTEAKCPFRFRKCNDKCALRVKALRTDNGSKTIGEVCAFAAIGSNITDISFAACYVEPPRTYKFTLEDITCK